MADYTPEQIEALAEFARWVSGFASHGGEVMRELQCLGITTPEGTLANWLRPEDWADRALREIYESPIMLTRAEQAAIIRKHAEDRT